MLWERLKSQESIDGEGCTKEISGGTSGTDSLVYLDRVDHGQRQTKFGKVCPPDLHATILTNTTILPTVTLLWMRKWMLPRTCQDIKPLNPPHENRKKLTISSQTPSRLDRSADVLSAMSTLQWQNLYSAFPAVTAYFRRRGTLPLAMDHRRSAIE